MRTDMILFYWWSSILFSGLLIGGCDAPRICIGEEVETAEGCSTCKHVWSELHDRVTEAVDANNRCSIAADCVFVTVETRCHHGCPEAVAAASESSFLNEVEEISENLCDDPMFQDMCGYITADCATDKLVCDDGRCANRFR